MSDKFTAPVKLSRQHDTSAFDCGDDGLNRYLKKDAYHNQQAGNASIYVTCRGDHVVVGYYAIATSGVEKAHVPDELKKGSVPSPVPCLLLARLAVDLGVQGLGVGRSLVRDVFLRAAKISDEVAFRVLLVHAKDETAREFYLHHAEFSASPTDSLHLMLLLKQVRRLRAILS